MIKTNLKNNKLNILVLLILFILLITTFVNATERSSSYLFSDAKIKILLGNVNRYEDLIDEYAKKFMIPKNFLKAIMAVETEGINYRDYNPANATGIMQIVPFNASGGDLNYGACLVSKCMKVELEPEDVTLDQKKARVKEEYGTPENSICCAAYLLKGRYTDETWTYNTSEMGCSIQVDTVKYTGWDLSAKRYNGFGCPPDMGHAFYSERVMQLKNAFDQLSGFDDASLGVLSFTPSFRIKSPEIITVFDELEHLVTNIQNACSYSDNPSSYSDSQDCIDHKLEAFEIANNVEFNHYCEEPEVNFINKFYDNFVNAIEFNEPECRYLVIDEFPFTIHDKPHELHFSFHGQVPQKIFTIRNNFTDDLFREYDTNVANDFLLGFDDIIVKRGASDGLFRFKVSSFIGNSPALDDIQKIYYVKDYDVPGESHFILYKNWIGENLYYDTMGNSLPDFNETKYPICDESLPNYKLKYFTCLDTKQKENVYNWITGGWEESQDNIIIKFAFSLNRQ